MTLLRAIGASFGALFVVSCTSAPPATTAATAATTAPAAAPNGPRVAGPARRVPPSRDSLAKLRAVYVAQVMATIAGRENQPAEQVFKNVQVLKGITAAALVQKMDTDYATAMSWNCTNCHRLAPQGNFASDTSNDKKRARFMQQLQNDINLVQLPKLYPKDTPKISCASCHRGYNEPPAPEYLLPERGKPGGLPVLPPPGSRPGS
jgi:Photosynthetic reaction centre cytochrome C subunit